MTSVHVNGRQYALPRLPTIVICYDGCDPEYIDCGLKQGILETIAEIGRSGFSSVAAAAVPTFTNPNNVSIVTGAPPSVHGISGNYVLDRATGERRMIVDASLMRCGTILAAMAEAGVRVGVVTAKDKLLRMLARDLKGVAFSAEYADRASLAGNGIENVEAMVGRPKPDPYSADLSLFVLEAGLHLLRLGAADLLYLSLSDFVQHAHAPGSPPANAFNRAVDRLVGEMIKAGTVVGIVADHGMKDKCRADGTPNVVFLEDALGARFGSGAATVICPITDPFVRHHGALGSFVRVYARRAEDIGAMMACAASLPGVACVFDGPTAASRFELPLDLEGDFVVFGDAGTVIGAGRADHDLSALVGERLRSHGGLAEQMVPFLVSRPLNARYADIAAGRPLRNFDIFDFVLNGTV
jgi:phosphonoacetate hydrolase